MEFGMNEWIVAFLPLILVIGPLIFWIWMLADCLKQEPPGKEKRLWVVVIVFTFMVGAILYFFVRRPQRAALR